MITFSNVNANFLWYTHYPHSHIYYNIDLLQKCSFFNEYLAHNMPHACSICIYSIYLCHWIQSQYLFGKGFAFRDTWHGYGPRLSTILSVPWIDEIKAFPCLLSICQYLLVIFLTCNQELIFARNISHL